MQAALDAGFVAAGIAPAQPSARSAFVRSWLDDGRHGSMHWMAEHVDVRVDPGLLVPGARSVLCVADRYDADPDEPLKAGSGLGRIARYARGRDYHRHMKKRLHRLCDAFSEHHEGHAFRACVDTAPVLEREIAAMAGLGAIGKNTLLIQQGVGSWLLLGEIVTTLPIEPTVAEAIDPCGTCTRCIDACPTSALTPFVMDATRCVSYLTIEHRSTIDPLLHEGMGDWIFGCDICQEVCPHNQPTHRTLQADADGAYATHPGVLDLLEVLDWDEDARVKALAGTAATRAKVEMWRRNVAIAARNQLRTRPNASLSAKLDHMANDPSESEMVRSAAMDRDPSLP